MIKHKFKNRQYLTRKASENCLFSCEGDFWVLIRVAWICLVIFTTLPWSGASCSSGSKIKWRSDGRCGPSFPFITTDLGSTISECDHTSDRPCCSDYGYCGNSASHCLCSTCVDYRKVMREPSCYFLLEGSSGYLESPGYPKPYPAGRDCCYDIRRPTHDTCGVTLTVEELDVGDGEQEGFCKADWLSLPSCVPERGTRICGNNTEQIYQYLYQPGASAMRFIFHSSPTQANRAHKGFRIRYDLIKSCTGPFQTQNLPISNIPGTSGTPCHTRIKDRKGTINSPYYPNLYPSNLDCIYEFVRTKKDICGIKMSSVSFDLETPIMTVFGGACTDFFHLPSCGFICGKVKFNWVVEYQPGASSLKFHFHTDESKGQKGFLISFEQISEC